MFSYDPHLPELRHFLQRSSLHRREVAPPEPPPTLCRLQTIPSEAEPDLRNAPSCPNEKVRGMRSRVSSEALDRGTRPVTLSSSLLPRLLTVRRAQHLQESGGPGCRCGLG